MSFFGLNFLIWLYWLYPSYHACTLYTILPNYVTCPLLRVYNCVYNCVGAFPGCKAKYWLSLSPQFIPWQWVKSKQEIKVTANLHEPLHICCSHYIMVCCLQWRYHGGGVGGGGGHTAHQTARRWASGLTWGRAPVGTMLSLVSFPDRSFRKCAMFTACCSETS